MNSECVIYFEFVCDGNGMFAVGCFACPSLISWCTSCPSVIPRTFVHAHTKEYYYQLNTGAQQVCVEPYHNPIVYLMHYSEKI